MEGFIIKDFTFIGANDRGDTYEFDNQRPGIQVLGRRKAGSINGRHFHAGRSQRKNPEIFMLLNGITEVSIRNLDSGVEEQLTVEGPKVLEIYPNIWHEIKAVTDIVFIELNSIKEHAADTEYLDEPVS